MTWARLYWPYWMMLTSITFLIPEFIAVFTNVKNTLSDYARAELNVTTHMTVHTVAWYVSLAGWLLFVLVITGHIWWGKAL